MNPRVLELLKNPKNIQSEDLNLLKEEINSFPYIQNIRALHLYGIHLFDKENYQKELSTTAAYTTDKKILYQLINGKIQQKAKPEIVEEEKAEVPKNTFKYIYKKSNFPIKREEKEEQIIEDKKQEEASLLQAQTIPEIKHLHVNGERNRILFEGEENFFDDDTADTIDLEATLESGSIVIQKAEKKPAEELANEVEEVHIEPVSEEKEVEKIAEFTPEIIINEEKVDSEVEEEKIDDEADVSFHEIEPSLSEEATQEDHLTEEHESDSVKAEEFAETEAKIEFTPEEIINEEKITSESETEKVNNDAELSFHGTESFLPDVKIQSNTIDETIEEEIAQPSNKHEDEMRRLIEEVEKKMKATKGSSEKEDAEPEVVGHEISFAETQHFNVEAKEEKIDSVIEEEKIKENGSELIETKPEAVAIVEEPKQKISEQQPETKSAWKPMSLESHVPDSMINKSIETPQPKAEIIKAETPKQEEILPQAEEVIELPKDNSEEIKAVDEEKIAEPEIIEEEEAPALNVSFFNSDIISSWAVDVNEAKEEKKSREKSEEVPAKIVNATPVDSNVPGFINTWQSWLKIDRPIEEAEEVEEVLPEVEKEKSETKNKVIESFIEKNPKISQLKDEVNFVVKEKTDDISHLMTETLATLYFEQKLYTKAIKAFNILIIKHPKKKEYFEGKIQDIKDVRGKN